MAEVLKNIRKYAIRDTVISLIGILIFFFMCIFSLFEVFYNDVIFLLLFCFSCFCAVCAIIKFRKVVPVAFNPLKSDVFKKYGNAENVEKVYNEVFSTKEYSDYIIYISKNYMCGYSRWDNLIRFDNIAEIRKDIVRNKFFVTVGYDIVVIDKYGDVFSFRYESGQEAQCDYALNYLSYKWKSAGVRCNQAMPSYSNLNNNIQNTSLSNTPITLQQPINQSQTFNSTKPTVTQPNSIIGKNNFCTRCGAKLIDGSKFCRKCGTVIYQNKN
jgi:hypothetical protein